MAMPGRMGSAVLKLPLADHAREGQIQALCSLCPLHDPSKGPRQEVGEAKN